MANSNTGELKVTRQKALTMALRFMLYNFKNITITQLEKEHGLARKTLYRILDGNDLPRCTDVYMRVFVRIINDRRRSALTMGMSDLIDDINHLFRDLMLVQYGVPTDREIAHSDHE